MSFERVLVTGGAGFIGSHLVDALVERGTGVVVVDNLTTGVRENVNPKAGFLEADVRDVGAMRDAIRSGVEAVVHEAARVSIRSSVGAFLDDAETNILGTLALIEASKGSRVKKIVYASSMAVYADDPERKPIPETYPKRPLSPYGIAKWSCENYLGLLSETLGIPAVSLRYFNVYGPRQGYTPYVGVITIFATELLSGRVPVIFGDGGQTRDFVSVRDIVRGTILALDREAGSDVFNIGSGSGRTVWEIARLLIQKIRPDAVPETAAARAEEVRFSVADITKAKSVLGYEPERKLEDEIDEIIEGCRRRMG